MGQEYITRSMLVSALLESSQHPRHHGKCTWLNPRNRSSNFVAYFLRLFSYFIYFFDFKRCGTFNGMLRVLGLAISRS